MEEAEQGKRCSGRITAAMPDLERAYTKKFEDLTIDQPRIVAHSTTASQFHGVRQTTVVVLFEEAGVYVKKCDDRCKSPTER